MNQQLVRDRETLKACKRHVLKTLRWLSRYFHSVELNFETTVLTININEYKCIRASDRLITMWLVNEDLTSIGCWLDDEYEIRREFR